MTAGRVLVTGGLGFVGSAFIRRIAPLAEQLVNIDAGTYAADPRRLAQVPNTETHRLDVTDAAIDDVIRQLKPNLVVHFAAETHVTRSEKDEDSFFKTNVRGTENVLTASCDASADLFVHISTDEVYGPCIGPAFGEEDKEPGEGKATSAYARSKAVADDLVLSYTDRLPVIVLRLTNCYGPWQHPEKAIPRWTIKAIAGERLPVWGDGNQVRDWMFVDDAAEAIETVIRNGSAGHVYNVAPQGEQKTNLEIASMIADIAGRPADAVYLTKYDRPSHDRRYAIDSSKLLELGWQARTGLEDGLRNTMNWYRENPHWWRPLIEEAEALYKDSEEKPN